MCMLKIPKNSHSIPLAINEAFLIHTGQIDAPQPDEKRQRKLSTSEVKKAAASLKRRASASSTSSTSNEKRTGTSRTLPPRRSSYKKDDALVAAFPVVYAFSAAVTQKRGLQVVNKAIDAAAKAKLPPGTGCILVISTEGIKIVDKMSFEVRAATVLKDVTFTTVCGMRGDKVAYITENETSGRVLVHVLKTGSDTAATVCESFQKAFIKAKEYALNPFKPTDGSRGKPPAHLFEHQIRRGHLEAINPVGAGQFGQVSACACVLSSDR